jgi:hypothetical protein
MWGLFQNRGYYQFTNGFTTRTATNDSTGSALASFLLGLPTGKQRQAGIPQMQLRRRFTFVQAGTTDKAVNRAAAIIRADIINSNA